MIWGPVRPSRPRPARGCRTVQPTLRRACPTCSIGRSAGDTEDVIKNRLRVYEEKTAPLVNHYRERELLRTVDGNQGIEQVAAAMLETLGVMV